MCHKYKSEYADEERGRRVRWVEGERHSTMMSKMRIGCAAVLLYCIVCSIAVEVTGRGFFILVGDIGTLQGGRECPKWVGHVLDIVTGPVQVTVLWPFLAIKSMCKHAVDKKQETL
jgi:hypothetical protein